MHQPTVYLYMCIIPKLYLILITDLHYNILCTHFAGKAPVNIQDSFMYRLEHGMHSVLVDDDNCDCMSSLSMGMECVAQDLTQDMAQRMYLE